MCDSCEALMINGILCHEQGCPDAWRDKERECKECGCMFIPKVKGQKVCSEQCANDYYIGRL